jgi:chemotaxis protein histidine kinase CheA
MTVSMDAFEALLATMRSDFLAEVPERCDALDASLLALEKFPQDKEIFMELFRQVHSLKGSGGTHGLPIMTMICHHFEDLLSEHDEQQNFDPKFVTTALSYIALLRKVQVVARHAGPDYTDIEAELEVLRKAMLKAHKACLIVETSASMRTLYQSILAEENVKITAVDNGLSALEFLLHEPFDFVIIGRELRDMDGAAVAATLRTTRGKNRDLPVILVTSNLAELPDLARLTVVLPRNNSLIESLATNVKRLSRQ